MTEITLENLLNQIVQLPPPERSRLWHMLEPLVKPAPYENGTQSVDAPQNGTSLKKKDIPLPMPNKDREMQWLIDHAREFAGQWVALDGDRLIAHGPDAKTVYAAARTDGAYLPMVTQVEDPARPFFTSQTAQTKEPLKPIAVPDGAGEMQWMQDHARAYIGQWIALDGNRLIAHGPDAKAVYAAARADGAYLPLVEFVTDPDRPFVF